MSFSTEHLTESARIKEYNTKKNLYHSRDPDRYYLDEYFKRLPATNGALSSSTDTIFSASVDVTADATSNTGTLTQPANTILVDAGVVVTGTITTGAATDIDIGTSASGAEIVDGADGLGSGSTIIASDVIASVGNTSLPVSGATTISFANAAPLFSSSSRTIYFTLVKNGVAVTSAGTVKFFIKFASTDSTTASEKNSDFELQGTNHSTGTITFNSTRPGINIQTNTGTNDQMIIVPHQNTNQSAWKSTTWGIDDELVWECAIRTGSNISDMVFWSGIKVTNTPTVADDDHQAYLLYASDDTKGTLTTNANLHFVYSVNGSDYITDLGIVLAVETIYKFKIMIDKDRKVSVYVNGKVYGLSTSGTAGGATQSNAGQKSLALTAGQALVPFIGIEDLGGATKDIDVYYQKMSRSLE